MAESLKIKKGGATVSTEKLENYAARVSSLNEDLQGLRGDMASVLKEAEDVGVHKSAFKLAVKLKNMSAEKRADFLRAFDEYILAFGLDDQPDMFDAAAPTAQAAE